MPAAGTNLCLAHRAIAGNSSVLPESSLDHHWEQQSLGGLNDSDFRH